MKQSREEAVDLGNLDGSAVTQEQVFPLPTDRWRGVERAGRTVEGPPMFIMTIAVGGLPAVPVVAAAAEARERRQAALEGGVRPEGRASMNAERGRLIVRPREIGSYPDEPG
jgi:hypothetical protein